MKLKFGYLLFFIMFFVSTVDARTLETSRAVFQNSALDDIEVKSKFILASNTANASLDDIETKSHIIITSDEINNNKPLTRNKIASINNNLGINTISNTGLSFLDDNLGDILSAGPYVYSPHLIRVIPTVYAPASVGAGSMISASVLTTLAVGGVAAAAAMGMGGGGGSDKSEEEGVAVGSKTEEYLKQYGLDVIKASYAYERGYTGENARIALLDGLVNYEHENFRINNEETNVPMCYDAIDKKGVNDCSAYKTSIKDEATHIAGIIAGLKNDNEMHGVAYDAMILTSNIFPTYTRFYEYSKTKYLQNLASAPPEPDDYEMMDGEGNMVPDVAAYNAALATWRTNVFTPALQDENVLCDTTSVWRSEVNYQNYQNPVWTTRCSITQDMIESALTHPMTHFFNYGPQERIGILNPNYCTIRRTINGVERNLVHSSTNLSNDACALYGTAEAQSIIDSWLAPAPADRAYVNALNKGADEKVIFVWPTGNGMEVQPSLDAALPLYAQVVGGAHAEFDNFWIEDPENPGSYLIKNWIAVNAVGDDNKATNYSNYCGDAKDFCISAPGGHGNQPDTGIYSSMKSGYDYESGTSMATAHVSGALAILVDMFGHSVESYEIIKRMFDTANKEGDYAKMEIYGQGLLDLEAATRPVGGLSLSLDSTIGGLSVSFDDTSIEGGDAFGDALLFGFSQNNIMTLDSMNFPFYQNMGRFVNISPKINILQDTLRNFDAVKTSHGIKYGDGSKLEFNYSSRNIGSSLPSEQKESITSLADFAFSQELSSNNTLQMSYNRSPSEDFGLFKGNLINKELLIDNTAFSNPYLNLSNESTSLTFNMNYDNMSFKSSIFQGNGNLYAGSRVMGAVSEMSFPLQNGSSVSLQLGTINENNSFLGTTGAGAFETSGITPTWFSGVNAVLPITNNINLMSNYNTAITSPSFKQNTIIKDISNLRTDSFTLGLVGNNFTSKNDTFGLYINQPVRVVSGDADLNIPYQRTPDGTVLTKRTNINLKPQGQEINLGAFYSLKPSKKTSLSLGLNHAIQPNHIKYAPDETTAILSFKKAF